MKFYQRGRNLEADFRCTTFFCPLTHPAPLGMIPNQLCEGVVGTFGRPTLFNTATYHKLDCNHSKAQAAPPARGVEYSVH